MAIHSGNEALMCKVFPSNLGPMAMQWFDALEEGSQTLGKLTFMKKFLSVKKNLGLVQLLGSQTLGKLTYMQKFFSVKQNLNFVRLLKSRTLGKLIFV